MADTPYTVIYLLFERFWYSLPGLLSVLLVWLLVKVLYYNTEAKKKQIEDLQKHKKKLIEQKRLLQREIEVTEDKIQLLTTGCTVQRYKVHRPPRTPEEQRINNILLWAKDLKKKTNKIIHT
jgi:hypothetical protein